MFNEWFDARFFCCSVCLPRRSTVRWTKCFSLIRNAPSSCVHSVYSPPKQWPEFVALPKRMGCTVAKLQYFKWKKTISSVNLMLLPMNHAIVPVCIALEWQPFHQFQLNIFVVEYIFRYGNLTKSNISLCLVFVAAHYDEIFYICLFFGIAVLILLSSIMIVFGRIILHKRNASTMNSGAASVSELSTTVDAMTKLQSSDTIVVTTMASDSDTNITKLGTNINNSTDEHNENVSDIDITTPISIPSISSRNNVSHFQRCYCFEYHCRIFNESIIFHFFLGFHSLGCLQQHLYNTYTPSSYANLEPSSISYALVPNDLYNGNQTMTLHSTMMLPASNQATVNSVAAAPAGLYNHTLPHNLRTYFNTLILWFLYVHVSTMIFNKFIFIVFSKYSKLIKIQNNFVNVNFRIIIILFDAN